MDHQLSGKRVLVTGGTRGIGRAAVLAFARCGARVAVVSRGGDREQALERELKELGAWHLLVRADVTRAEEVTELADRMRESLGGLDVLVNNVGVDGHTAFDELTPDEWHRVVDHNVTSTYLVTGAVLDLLGAGASVVNVGASVALRGRPGGAHYAASKAALIGLGRSLAKELGPRGVRVNTVAPGVMGGEPGSGPPPAVAARIAATTALGRLGRPAEVAGAILFLAGAASSYVTGQVLDVDGGI
ncbi:SDR family NAD(P)-dependent oxidoreductase [Streptomyces griseorubiginosus]|uniref:SDR family NAD(P)-dependent oxidoreductase n=1 Tax=Streptomyces griseorubiginosus TaxID=67304 RepID=UPI0036923B79